MQRNRPILFTCHPQAASIPWVGLGRFPTPVEALAVGPAGGWVKRDDLSSPLYGGNKVRPLEFLLGHALALGARSVITAGAVGSHHVSATALFAREVGLGAEAILWDQPWSPRCDEALALLHRLEVPVIRVRRPAAALATLVRRWLAGHGRGVYLIPPGGASARGALGFVDAGLELAGQVAAGEMDAPDCIWLACGTGGTAAGLCVGLALGGLQARVRAVRVTPRLACCGVRLLQLTRGAAGLLRRAGVPVPPFRLPELVQGYFGPGYAAPTPASEAAVEMLHRGGLPGETTYTGKAFAAMLALAPLEGGRHLFWETFGPAG